MEKVVVTGTTGLIGKESIIPLQKSGFEVIRMDSASCNLFDFDKVSWLFNTCKPKYLLHFAWITGEKGYLQNPINSKYYDASFNLLKQFYNNGGYRAVYAGTYFEYDLKASMPLSESSPLHPTSIYAENKARLQKICSEFCKEHSASFSWGRIFNVYGHGEKAGRLTSSLVTSLLEGKTFTVRCGQLLRDYMYSKDIASAFVRLLLSDVQGAVNICTGKGIKLANFAMKIAEKLSKEQLLEIHEEETDQPLSIIGDNSRLRNEVLFDNFTDIDSALDSILDEYRWT